MDDLFTMFKSMMFERDRETGSRFMKSCESRLYTVYYPYKKKGLFLSREPPPPQQKKIKRKIKRTRS